MSRSPGPSASGATPKADVALYHVGNDPEAHGWNCFNLLLSVLMGSPLLASAIGALLLRADD